MSSSARGEFPALTNNGTSSSPSKPRIALTLLTVPHLSAIMYSGCILCFGCYQTNYPHRFLPNAGGMTGSEVTGSDWNCSSGYKKYSVRHLVYHFGTAGSREHVKSG